MIKKRVRAALLDAGARRISKQKAERMAGRRGRALVEVRKNAGAHPLPPHRPEPLRP